MPRINLLPKKHTTGATKQAHQVHYQSRGYRMARAEKLRLNPICEECEKVGVINPVDEVHHVTPIMTGRNKIARQRLAEDINNLKSLCYQCHEIEHNRK